MVSYREDYKINEYDLENFIQWSLNFSAEINNDEWIKDMIIKLAKAVYGGRK